MDLDKICLFQDLFQIYKNLLTEHQKNVFKSYYFDNFSLSEIAENFDVSRQAVKDILDRCEKTLLSLEENLQIKLNNDKLINELSNTLSKKELDKVEKLIYKRN